jgi:tetratricopeptide (TPR) repeat protein
MSDQELVDVGSLWDFDDPAASERRFRAAATSADPSEGLVWRTQVARALGLQGRYDEALRELADIDAAGSNSVEVGVRSLLERGRVHNSAGDAAIARELFERAEELGARSGPGPSDPLVVDALHMQAIAAAPEDRLRLNERALEVARSSSDPRANDWDASLLNNIGMCQVDGGRLDEALDAFEAALAARRRIGDDARTRVARWMVAWVKRLQGRLDEARAEQLSLQEELDRLGLADPYVDEELALLADT